MSAVKNILAIVSDATTGKTSLTAALRAARYLDAHVDALHVRPDPVAAVPMVGEVMTEAMINEMMILAQRDSNVRAAKAQALFKEVVTADARPGAAAWIEDTGFEANIVALRGCRADLIVVQRPVQENSMSMATLNAAVLQSGRPVLSPAPGAAFDTSAFKRMAVYWSGSMEATRAVAAAMPFLSLAEQVTVLRAEDEESYVPSDDIGAYLRHHGVGGLVFEDLPKGGAGAAILSGATAANAGMLVMGAYTHSKLRQLILGSVTAHVMEHARMPVLLSH